MFFILFNYFMDYYFKEKNIHNDLILEEIIIINNKFDYYNYEIV